MRTAIVEYKVYKYNELSDNAKEKVKEWYLNGQDSFAFTEICKEDLYCLFGKNNLDVQYSLGYCQGDGFNIYGKIGADKIFDCLEKHNGGSHLRRFEDVLTKEEKEIILAYAKECGEINLPMNNRYCYYLTNYIDISEEWAWQLKSADYTEINDEVLVKFERLVRGIFTELCRSYEKQGYEFFYEISDEDLEELCDCNGWEFLEDGTIF